MVQQCQVSNFSQKERQPQFVSTIYTNPQMFGKDNIICNLYIRNIPWSLKKSRFSSSNIQDFFSLKIPSLLLSLG